jgi:hypothetical protein
MILQPQLAFDLHFYFTYKYNTDRILINRTLDYLEMKIYILLMTDQQEEDYTAKRK